jgi:hypothetical protein
MSTTGEVFLGIIAVAVAVMALIQVGAIVAGLRLARRVNQITTQLEQEVKPLLAQLTAISTQLTAISTEAAKATALAGAQVERFDKTITHLLTRVEQTVSTAHHIVTGPARNGLAVVAGVKAAMGAFQTFREASRRRSAVRNPIPEDEESLFIG